MLHSETMPLMMAVNMAPIAFTIVIKQAPIELHIAWSYIRQEKRKPHTKPIFPHWLVWNC
jgi:hypothetical protein